jgi:hypothetical protein
MRFIVEKREFVVKKPDAIKRRAARRMIMPAFRVYVRTVYMQFERHERSVLLQLLKVEDIL